jgi:ribosomal peptide maturation radical SAM protein 1
MRVALVNMPFFTVYHPSIGLGLLKSALTRDEVSCDVVNLNIDCAEWIGLSDYNAISHTFTSVYNALIGEWLFSRSLFGTDAPDPDRYIQEILVERCGRHLPQDFIRRIPRLRESIDEFVVNCAAKVDWEKYEIVGLATSFQQTTGCLALAKLLKAKLPDAVMVMGGANCEGEMGLTLLRAFPFIDAVFSGEADHTFPHFVRAMSSGQELGKLDGVFHRIGGSICEPRNPIKPVDNLDELPYPDYDDYFDQLERSSLLPEITGPHSPQVIVETSRGCWWGAKQHCTFCGLNGSSMAFRSKSPERALEEFKYLHQKYRCFLQVVDNILDLQYIKTLFPKLAEENLGIQLFYETKVNLSKEQLQVLKTSGVIALQPGIESLNTNVLQLMRKGCTALQNVQFLKCCKELGIEAGWNFIWGFPDEDEADYASMGELVDRIRHLTPPMAVNKLQLHRFSPYFAAREAMGISNIRPHPSYVHIFPLPSHVIAGMAYYFTFDYKDGRNPRSYASGVIRKLREWQQAEGERYLMYVDDGDTLTILRGVRRQAPSRTYLRSAERQLYLFCGQVRTLAKIVEFAQERTEMILTTDVLQQWLRNMVYEGLILKDNDTYLSLAVDVTQKCNSNTVATYNPVLSPATVVTSDSLIQALPLTSDKHPSADLMSMEHCA